MPFWAGLPGPSNPWPALFTFENGTFQISGMTLTDPYTAPTQGWIYPYGSGTYIAIWAGIGIRGIDTYVSVDHVTVLGASGDDLGTNMVAAVYYDGTVLPAGWSDPFASVIALTSTLKVTNSVIDSASDGVWAGLVTGATIRTCYDTFLNSPAPWGFNDVPGSQLVFCGNSIPNAQ